jgi:hypothetical protein
MLGKLSVLELSSDVRRMLSIWGSRRGSKDAIQSLRPSARDLGFRGLPGSLASFHQV